MTIQKLVPLASHTTFRIGGPADFFVDTHTDAEVEEVGRYAREERLPLSVLGGGSNVLVPDAGVRGLVLRVASAGIALDDQGSAVECIAEAGTPWEEVVHTAGSAQLWGIENLAGIPGTVGGAVVQNIGAYGAELAESLAWVEVFDTQSGTRTRFSKQDIAPAYRDSIFKKRPELIILRAALRLTKTGAPRLIYPDLAKLQHDALVPLTTPEEIARAVRAIRAAKFPDLTKEGTAGSFFKNPVVEQEEAEMLATQFPGMRQFTMADGRVKIALAWILDHALELKGFRMGNARLFEQQPLVIVTEFGATAHDVDALAEEVCARVHAKTGISIEREVVHFA